MGAQSDAMTPYDIVPGAGWAGQVRPRGTRSVLRSGSLS